jgi:hypothetical protein
MTVALGFNPRITGVDDDPRRVAAPDAERGINRRYATGLGSAPPFRALKGPATIGCRSAAGLQPAQQAYPVRLRLEPGIAEQNSLSPSQLQGRLAPPRQPGLKPRA